MGGGLPPEIKPLGNDELKRLFSTQAHELGLENYRGHLTEYQVDTQRSFEMFRAGTTTGAEAIKAVTLINGGAAVAVLAFIGHLVSIRATPLAVMNFAEPLALFVIGVFVSVLGSNIAYLVSWCYVAALGYEFAGKEARRDGRADVAAPRERAARKWNRTAWGVNLTASALVAVSLVLFACGCVGAYHALKSSAVTLTEDHAPSSNGLF